MTKLSPNFFLFIFVVIIIFLAVSFSAWLSPQPFIFKSFGLDDIIQSLLFLFFISLLLERFLEVFITTWRGDKAAQLDIIIQQQKWLISERRRFIAEQDQPKPVNFLESNQINDLPPEGVSLEQHIIQKFIQSQKQYNPQIEDLNTIINELNEQERKKVAYKSDTRIIALWTSLLFGFLLSGIGIRSIEPLVVIDLNNPIQIIIFRCLDALLTGGVISGGSEGIHKLIQVFINFMEATSRQIKNQRFS
ncbi:hypothetical protein [Nostoc sp. CCY0012]|uniref:hypothetical protein n=1 Tax=Nostoc sp. CCY0012 TaxID=1056123 RepID=UPI0039C6FE92